MRLHVIGNPDMPYHKAEEYQEFMVPVLAAAGHEVTLSTDHTDINTRLLADLDVLLLYTTGNDLGTHQTQALQRFVESGGGLVGIHSATDSFKNSQTYLDLMGGRFIWHPPHHDFPIHIEDPAHPITAGLEDFDVFDELYIMSTQSDHYHLLVSCAWESDEGNWPVAWVREVGEGRVYYCSLGHTPEALQHPTVRELHLRGAEWAARLR